MSKKILAFEFITLVFVSFAMRIPMSAIGPVLGSISLELNLSATQAGMVTTLPLIIFSLSALCSPKLIKRYSLKVLIFVYVLFITIGVFVRSLGQSFGLFVGTALIGVGTGMLNATMPAFIRSSFSDRVGLMMGTYSTAMTLASAGSAAFIVPFTSILGSWQLALASGLFLIIPSAVLSLISVRKKTITTVEESSKTKLLCKKNIFIALYIGFQSLLFYIILSWYPTIMTSLHSFSLNSGLLVSIMQIVALIPSFVVPVISKKENCSILSSSIAFLFIPGFILAGFGSSLAIVVLGTVISGLACGGTFSMALTFCQLGGKNSNEVASITSFGQFIGYILASLGPIGVGYSFDLTGSWKTSIIIMSTLAFLMGIFGLISSRIIKNS